MAFRRISATGIEALQLTTELLHRVRLSDPLAGVWEAADFQWAWRRSRQTDDVPQDFWMDDQGPVATVKLTNQVDSSWQCDPILVRGAIDPDEVWQHAIEIMAEHPHISFTVVIGDDDLPFARLVQESGFVPLEQDYTGWLDAADRPTLIEVPDGFVLVGRAQRRGVAHPMRHLNGDQVNERLLQCSLYDASLDLAIETEDATVAGYSLYWFDPVTKVGLIEPVRVMDAFQRRGLARTMLSVGINRLVDKGAERIKVSWETEAAGALYLGTGFQLTSSTTTYLRTPGGAW